MCTILIANRPKDFFKDLQGVLKSPNYSLLYAVTLAESLEIIKNRKIDILVVEISFQQWEENREFLFSFKQFFPASKILGAVNQPGYDQVITLAKEGVDHLIEKEAPVSAYQEKLEEIDKALSGEKRSTNLLSAIYKKGVLSGKSAAIQTVLQKIQIIAEHEVECCLIVGENGTGKELVARTIHRWSPRSQDPFLALNCAGIAENLIDSELFGFEKGSFTGAYHTNVGKFEMAEKGVIFLDEISEMPPTLQAKLLRVLENREVLRIGGKKTIPINVMILASTNRDLKDEIRKGTFREDIFYRLNLVRIELPPLRKRRDDIPMLVTFFLKQINKKLNKSLKLAPGAFEILDKYHFPGNVRELKNIIYSAALFSAGDVLFPGDFEAYFSSDPILESKLTQEPKQRATDSETIKRVLAETNGNRTQAAKILGYSREGLSRKLKRMGVE